MPVAIIDDRKTNLVLIGNLVHGDGFIHEGDLYLVLSTEPEDKTSRVCQNITETFAHSTTQIVCDEMLLNTLVEPVSINILVGDVE